MTETPRGAASTEGTAAPGGRRAELTGTQRAVTALREGIRTGRYVAGQRLVEADLTRELNVGRNSLREAFSRLRSEGLVHIEPHRGASIRRMSRQDIVQLYELSEVLEGLAARLAADRIARTGDKEPLETAVAVLREAAAEGEVGRLVDASAQFHRAVAELSGHSRLSELIDQLHIQTFSLQLRQPSGHGLADIRDDSVSEHLELADTIMSGDPVAAESLMREHLRSAKERFLRLPDDFFS